MTRRRLLGRAAQLAAAAFAATLMPPNVRRAMAAPAPPGGWHDVRHVVLLMQENRSFDHYFGTLAGVRGFNDPTALVLPDGQSVFHQPDVVNPTGYMLPFHLDTLRTNAQKIPSTSHEWDAQHQSWNNGQMNLWLAAHRAADGHNGPYVMGYYTRQDIPFHFALADAFTICDAYHCSIFGPTWPNRLYWMTGTIDPEGHNGGPTIENDVPDGFWRWTTYAERLEEAGVSWKVYQERDNYDCNVLKYFRSFQQAQPGSGLYYRGLTHAEYGFERDAVNDRLPAVSWIMPTSVESEHPDYLPAAGAAFIARKLDAVASNPKVWAKTVFILCYDENDGLFDHVPPPVPPPGTPGEFIDGLPLGAGFRVPCIIISPWTVGGWVCSDLFDHTSILRFLERFTGVVEPNITAWRRQTFGDLTSAFRFEAAPAPPPLLVDTHLPLQIAEAGAKHLPPPAVPPVPQTVPAQEAGLRRSVPVRVDAPA
jgi:phospholipase C